VTGTLHACHAVKFDSGNNLWSSVHSVILNILHSVSLKIKRKLLGLYYTPPSKKRRQHLTVENLRLNRWRVAFVFCWRGSHSKRPTFSPCDPC